MNKDRKTRENIRIRKELKKGQKYQIESICKSHKKKVSNNYDKKHQKITSKACRNVYSHLFNKRDVTLTDFGKFHPAQNKNLPCTFIDFNVY